MIAAPPWDMLQERWPLWKAGLYDLEVISPQGRYFQIGGLAYDTSSLQEVILYYYSETQ